MGVFEIDNTPIIIITDLSINDNDCICSEAGIRHIHCRHCRALLCNCIRRCRNRMSCLLSIA